MLRVTPVYGSQWSSGGQALEPQCCLVEYAGARILWNVGWWALHQQTQSTSSTLYHQEEEEFPSLPQHDVLILTDSTLLSSGGLPLYHRRFPYTPIYATFPTAKMGQMTLYDVHASLAFDGRHPLPFTLDEVDRVFERIRCIKYNQSIRVIQRMQEESTSSPTSALSTVASSSVTLTAHRAGHVVGGAFFVLLDTTDDTHIVLTSHYHIARELHLDSSSLLEHAASCDVLVTYPGGPSFRALRSLSTGSHPLLPPLQVRQAEHNVVETILATLRRDGNVLLPVDAAGRVFELALLLQHTWEKHHFASTYNLVWVSPMIANTLEFARCQLEWMNEQLSSGESSLSLPSSVAATSQLAQQQQQQRHPLQLKHVHFCSTVIELEQFLEDNPSPSCVLASGLSLDCGPARDVLLQWADNPDNAVLFTDSSQCYLRHYRRYDKQLKHKHPHQLPRNPQQQDDPNPSSSTTLESTPPIQQNLVTAKPSDSNNISGSGIGDDGRTVAVAVAVTADIDTAETVATISEWTAAAQLLWAWGTAKVEGREMDDSVTIDVPVPIRTPLMGAELAAFLAREEAKRQDRILQQEKIEILRQVEQLRLSEHDVAAAAAGFLHPGGSSSSNVANTSGTVSTMTTTMIPTAPTNSASDRQASTTQRNPSSTEAAPSTRAVLQSKKRSRFDSALFLKFSKPLHLTFEAREEAIGVTQDDTTAKFRVGEVTTTTAGRRNRDGTSAGGSSGGILEDDYGIAVVPEKFKDIVTGLDPSKLLYGNHSAGRLKGIGLDIGGIGSAKQGGSKLLSSSGTNIVSDDDKDDEGLSKANVQSIEAADLSEGTGTVRGRQGRPSMKVSVVIKPLEVLAEIFYVPLEGRVDARSARQSVRALLPRQVIVLGGPCVKHNDASSNNSIAVPLELVDEVQLLADSASTFTHQLIQMTPSDGEAVELKVGHSAYAARIVDTVVSNVSQQQKQQPQPRFEAKLGPRTVSLLKTIATGQKVAVDGSVVLASLPHSEKNNDDDEEEMHVDAGDPENAVSNHPRQRRRHFYVSDGEVLLTYLRADLIALGMKADYSTHASGYSKLVVNGTIVVTRVSDSGAIHIEGPLCKDFFTVRASVSGQFVTL